MLPSPNSSPAHRVPLETRTNVTRTPQHQQKLFFNLLTPPTDKKLGKRPYPGRDQPLQKHIKLSHAGEDVRGVDDGFETDSDIDMEERVMMPVRRRHTSFRMHTGLISRPAGSFKPLEPSTLSILRSFVSSHKSDVFKCQSTSDNTHLTPPYACSYTRGAKLGGTPLLAVATEQGSVHILNTSRRKDWDTEPQRQTIQPHNNGIFDVKWNHDDTLLATCSGDRSTRISCAETGAITYVLRGHASTVKCAAWDPNHHDLLATGGRDGAVCLWDLRVGEVSGEEGIMVSQPVIIIPEAHEDMVKPKRPKKHIPVPRSVTGILYPESEPYGIVTSGSFDGILRYWDLRTSSSPRKSRSTKPKTPTALMTSPVDPTTLYGSRRPRGITSLTTGSGPTAGLVFAVGADARIHTYSLPSLTALPLTYSHENMQSNSFYVGLSVSPCGRWLASGGSGSVGSNFLFDVGGVARPGAVAQEGIELRGQIGEVGAVDWADDMLATCADDGTVRVWRPDIETYRKCQEDPKESKWEWSWSA
ncbi:WD40-repeat-containing domain protein [Crucibulum laeve]|uniref:WD40-repeat-containing domain protein n=1 Tax=Crucibulum laeve TaxID=68775 RepID=A0A5C3MCU6_9AGAR|nr:WD40-repeat-containing domain protein [Crucibulum laeve]